MTHSQVARPAMRILRVVAALALFAPSASAHDEDPSQAQALEAGPYLIFFDLRPSPPYAESAVSMVAQISDASTGTLMERAPASVVVAGPEAFSQRKTMEPDGTGYVVASMVLPERGMYSARIFVRDEATNETHAADTEFEVFPDIPYRIRHVDPTADVYTGQRVPLAFELVDPVTLEPKQVGDLSVKLEHWSEDHTQYLGEQNETATPVSRGTWRIEPVFGESGMYHIRFASAAGGFNYADVPLLHVYAISPQSAGVDEKESPGAGALLVLALLAGIALLRRR